MSNDKRKPRTSMIKTTNLLLPVDITKLGTEEDVCFGKLNDPKAPECQRCGDCELCQIVMAQTMHVTRAKVEKKGKYRDIEEEEIYKSKVSGNPIKKKSIKDRTNLKKAIRGMVRKFKKIDKEALIEDIAVQQSVSKLRVAKILRGLLKTTAKFKLIKNNLVWNQEK